MYFLHSCCKVLNNIIHSLSSLTKYSDVFAVVSLDSRRQYRLSVFSDESVPLFGPSLPCPPVFKNHDLFRQFLLVKLINGEKATFDTPTFSRKRERTLDMLIKDLYNEHMTEARMVSCSSIYTLRQRFPVLSI